MQTEGPHLLVQPGRLRLDRLLNKVLIKPEGVVHVARPQLLAIAMGSTLILGTGSALTAPPASAAPESADQQLHAAQQQVRSARQQLDAVQVRAEQAAEAYNGARLQAGQAAAP